MPKRHKTGCLCLAKEKIRVDQLMLTITTGDILIMAAFFVYSAYGQMKEIALNEATEKAEEKLVISSQHDPLTGLYHRTGLSKVCRKLSQNTAYPFAILMADVDNFKRLNDTFGHSAGDLFLLEVGQAFQDALYPQDSVSRMGGDEFLALLPDVTSDTAKQIKNKVDDKLNFISATHANLQIGISTGITTIHHRQSFEDAIKLADQAMYHTKTARKVDVF